MTIRTGKLHKPCTKCGKYFKPCSRYTRLCDKCYLEAMQHARAKEKPDHNHKQEVLAIHR